MKNKILFPAIFFIALPFVVNAQTKTQPKVQAKASTAHKQQAGNGADAVQLPPGVPPAQGPVRVQFALRYQDLVTGTGPEAQPGQVYRVHYTGYLESNGTKFDTSLDGEPIEFIQGQHLVIPGWDEGFAGMRVGGKRRLFIPYQLGYGVAGSPPEIPSKANLIFDIELIDVRANNMPGPRAFPPDGTVVADPPSPSQPPSPPVPPQPGTPPQK